MEKLIAELREARHIFDDLSRKSSAKEHIEQARLCARLSRECARLETDRRMKEMYQSDTEFYEGIVRMGEAIPGTDS